MVVDNILVQFDQFTDLATLGEAASQLLTLLAKGLPHQRICQQLDDVLRQIGRIILSKIAIDSIFDNLRNRSINQDNWLTSVPPRVRPTPGYL